MFEREYFDEGGDNFAELNVADCRCFLAGHTVKRLLERGGAVRSVSVDGDSVNCGDLADAMVDAFQALCKRQCEYVGAVLGWKGRMFDALATASGHDPDAFHIELVHTPRPLLLPGVEERNFTVFTDFLSLGIEIYTVARARALGIYCTDVYKNTDPSTWGVVGIVVFPQIDQ